MRKKDQEKVKKSVIRKVSRVSFTSLIYRENALDAMTMPFRCMNNKKKNLHFVIHYSIVVPSRSLISERICYRRVNL